MNKFKKFMSVAMIALLAANMPVTAYAAPTEQTKEPEHRTLTRAERRVLYKYFDADYYAEQDVIIFSFDSSKDYKKCSRYVKDYSFDNLVNEAVGAEVDFMAASDKYTNQIIIVFEH